MGRLIHGNTWPLQSSSVIYSWVTGDVLPRHTKGQKCLEGHDSGTYRSPGTAEVWEPSSLFSRRNKRQGINFTLGAPPRPGSGWDLTWNPSAMVLSLSLSYSPLLTIFSWSTSLINNSPCSQDLPLENSTYTGWLGENKRSWCIN